MKTKVLDHGYVELVETWGSDERIIEAARMSTGKGFQGWGPKYEQCVNCRGDWQRPGGCDKCEGGLVTLAGDEKLLAYLHDNKHTTPFEMAGMVIEVQAPIMVFREWHRHRTQSYNEMSARYVPLPDMNYVPTIERLMIGSDGKNKQAGTIKDAAVLTEVGAMDFQNSLAEIYLYAEQLYQDALRSGVPKELARVHLPVGRYSRMRASANLLNWLKFLTLRMDSKAQWEIRQFANEVGTLIEMAFPRTWTLFIQSKQS